MEKSSVNFQQGNDEFRCAEKLDSLDIDEEDSERETVANGSIQSEKDKFFSAFYQCLKDKEDGMVCLEALAKSEVFDVNHAFVEAFIELPYRSWTALHFVCKKDQVKFVNVLLKLGANASLENSKGETALHIACKYGQHQCVQALLNHCPDIKDKQNIQGLTPLMKAIYRCDTSFHEKSYERTIDTLIAAGCNVNLCPPSDMSPVHVAAGKWNSTELVKKLIAAGADVNISTHQKNASPLMTALCRQKVNTETVITLINAGADVNYQNPYGKSLLHVAVAKSEDICVEHLLQAGANPNVLDGDGDSPLWIAVSENNVRIAPMLLKFGADVNFANRDYHMSLLCRAASSSNVHLTELLLSYGADINMNTRLGATALHYAVDNQNEEIVKMLLRRNCCLDDYSNFRDLYNPMNALQIAFSRNDDYMVKLLILAGFPLEEVQVRHLPANIKENEELVSWIREQFYNTKTLKHLCRLRLRNIYQTDIKKATNVFLRDCLIPRTLVDFVLMIDLLGQSGRVFDMPYNAIDDFL